MNSKLLDRILKKFDEAYDKRPNVYKILCEAEENNWDKCAIQEKILKNINDSHMELNDFLRNEFKRELFKFQNRVDLMQEVLRDAERILL